MAIIQLPTVYANDTAGKQARTKDQIIRASSQTYASLKGSTQSLFNLVWKNQYGLTPQQVFDALGTDAASLHGLFAPVAGILNAAVPGSINLTEPDAVTVNPDGTCTVVIPPPPSSS